VSFMRHRSRRRASGCNRAGLWTAKRPVEQRSMALRALRSPGDLNTFRGGYQPRVIWARLALQRESFGLSPVWQSRKVLAHSGTAFAHWSATALEPALALKEHRACAGRIQPAGLIIPSLSPPLTPQEYSFAGK
jgi:hypothetical protein